ncbi:hypothetical protein MFMK1_003616 [Metallumcola ferriviriculae]|uniref:Uncharacterized protein n=1 Tax=Metallumcola ferriviriculae TaxID=3039180 RepID=A0AAU0UTV7_9FIRM|nr:hypothetical protein MFMK1_003616 [Desulfitibacteraceae bacterium MK1]
MNWKAVWKTVGLFLYVILVGFVIYKGEAYGKELQSISAATFNMYPAIIFNGLFPILIGLLLGIPELVSELKKSGRWRWNWVKFLGVGLPTFIVALIPLVAYSPISKYFYLLILLLGRNQPILILSGVVFGYIFLTSPYKQAEA